MKLVTAEQLVDLTVAMLHMGPGPHPDGSPQSVHGGGASPSGRPSGPVFTPEWKREAAIVAAGPETRQKIAEDFVASQRATAAKRYVAYTGDLTKRTPEKRKQDIATLAKKDMHELRAIQAEVTSQQRANSARLVAARRAKRDTAQIEQADTNLDALRTDVAEAISRVAARERALPIQTSRT